MTRLSSLVLPMALLAGGLILGAAGCSDDSASTDTGMDASPDLDSGPTGETSVEPEAGADQGVDAQQPDQFTFPPNSNMGAGCQSDADCQEASPTCIFVAPNVQVGICSTTCDPDSPKTEEDEDTCPAGYRCGIFQDVGPEIEYYCLRECTPSLTENTCPPSAQQTCSPLSDKYTMNMGHAVCLYPACQSGRDCPVYSHHPCSSDADCKDPLGSEGFCPGHHCALPGNCTASGMCGPHTLGNEQAQVGDPCGGDLDCPGTGVCLTEEENPYGPHPHYHNGYCSVPNCMFAQALPEFACPAGSVCNALFNAGLCQMTCDIQDPDGCRNQSEDNGGDYDCYAFDNVILQGGTPVASEPVCAPATIQACTSLGAGVKCADLGAAGNPTNMACRDPVTGQEKGSATAPGGYCLDETASGPFQY